MDVLKNSKMCLKWIPKDHNRWADRKKSLLYWLTEIYLFLSQSQTSGASLIFFKYVEVELLDITFSALFLQVFSMFYSFGFFFPPFFPPLAVSETLTRAGLTKLQECLSASSDLALRSAALPSGGIFSHFSHLEGEPQINALTDTSHLNMSNMPSQKDRAQLLWHCN